MVTVVATGFGPAMPNLRVVERAVRQAAVNDDMRDLESPAWRRREARPQWGRTDARGDSLEVPTFLRRQMD